MLLPFICKGCLKKGIPIIPLFGTYLGFLRLIEEYIISLDPPPTPHPQPRTHRAAAYRALAHEPQPREPMPIGLQPRELQPR